MATTTDFDDVVKEDRSFSRTAPRGHNHLRLAANAFRFLELCLALFLLFWISARLPLAVQIFCEYSRQLLSFVARPLVVFIFFNTIIAAVAAKSTRLTAQNSGQQVDDVVEVFCGEMIVNLNETPTKPSEQDKEIVYQDKQTITEMSAAAPASEYDAEDFSDSESGSETSDSDAELELEYPRAYRRTKSEKLERKSQAEDCEGRALRRSETEKYRKVDMSGEGVHGEEDDLSNEEFQRAIEAFIAKELRFRREESLAIVLQ